MKQLLVIALMFASCSKQASNQPATETRKAKGHIQVEAASPIVLTNNGGGSFSIDYGGVTNIQWMFFRTGETFNADGSVYPDRAMSFYQNPVTTFQSVISGTNYQSVVVTTDATYFSNIVQ